EHIDVGHDAGAALIEPRRNGLIQIAGSGVKGAAEGAGVDVECVPEPLFDDPPYVDNVDAGAGGQLEVELDRCQRHQVRFRPSMRIARNSFAMQSQWPPALRSAVNVPACLRERA